MAPTKYETVAEFASRLSCHPATIWRKSKAEPDFPKPVRFGGLTRWKKAEIDAYLAKAEAQREAA